MLRPTDSATSEAPAAPSENPSSKSSNPEIPQWVDRLVDLMDNRFRLPGTTYRFGYDGLLGLLPGIGDLITTALGFSVVYAAWKVDAPKRVMGKMLANLAFDAVIGSVPVAGDAVDFVFKANRRNLEILQNTLENRESAA